MTTKERPILFSGPMVRAILEGRKTQTRRAVKPQPKQREGGISPIQYENGEWEFLDLEGAGQPMRNPYGQRGDRLWVREAFCFANDPPATPDDCLFRADDNLGIEDISEAVWKPSIHMPRWASRITLRIVRIRVERLQDIGGRDAIEEGIDFNKHECGCEVCARSTKLCPATNSSLVMEYAALWDSINRKTHPWETNPWVLVIEFWRV